MKQEIVLNKIWPGALKRTFSRLVKEQSQRLNLFFRVPRTLQLNSTETTR